MGAKKGNTNRLGKTKPIEERVPEPETLSLSWTSRRKERLRNAIAWHEGYIPEDDEVAAKARSICYEVLDLFCESIEKDQERAIIP